MTAIIPIIIIMIGIAQIAQKISVEMAAWKIAPIIHTIGIINRESTPATTKDTITVIVATAPMAQTALITPIAIIIAMSQKIVQTKHITADITKEMIADLDIVDTAENIAEDITVDTITTTIVQIAAMARTAPTILITTIITMNQKTMRQIIPIIIDIDAIAGDIIKNVVEDIIEDTITIIPIAPIKPNVPMALLLIAQMRQIIAQIARIIIRDMKEDVEDIIIKDIKDAEDIIDTITRIIQIAQMKLWEETAQITRIIIAMVLKKRIVPIILTIITEGIEDAINAKNAIEEDIIKKNAEENKKDIMDEEIKKKNLK